MLRNGGKEYTGISHLGKAMQAVYHMGVLIWQAVRSCFGSGFWQDDLPWSNDDAWDNG